MTRGWHYAKLSLSNASSSIFFWHVYFVILVPFSLSFLFVFFFFCSHWSLVDVPLIFFCPADHVPDWQPPLLLGMVEARSVNVKKTTTTVCALFEYGLCIFLLFIYRIVDNGTRSILLQALCQRTEKDQRNIYQAPMRAKAFFQFSRLLLQKMGGGAIPR